MKRPVLVAALALTGCLALAPAGAGAAERVVAVESEGPGPAELDRVYVHHDGAPAQSHLDPLTAAPGSNLFLSRLQEFLADYVKPPAPSLP